MTSVSVVIPCYNYGHFLEEAVFFEEILKAAAAMFIPGLCCF